LFQVIQETEAKIHNTC